MGLSISDAGNIATKISGKAIKNKSFSIIISNWENGVSVPNENNSTIMYNVYENAYKNAGITKKSFELYIKNNQHRKSKRTVEEPDINKKSEPPIEVPTTTDLTKNNDGPIPPTAQKALYEIMMKLSSDPNYLPELQEKITEKPETIISIFNFAADLSRYGIPPEASFKLASAALENPNSKLLNGSLKDSLISDKSNKASFVDNEKERIFEKISTVTDFPTLLNLSIKALYITTANGNGRNINPNELFTESLNEKTGSKYSVEDIRKVTSGTSPDKYMEAQLWKFLEPFYKEQGIDFNQEKYTSLSADVSRSSSQASHSLKR